MSKLDGNIRWKSKMLLTEHQEQYQNRDSTRPAGRVTMEELEKIRDAIMLPHMLTISDRSLEDVRRSHNPYKKFFEQFIWLLMNNISTDLKQLKRELSRNNIKVYDDETADGIIYYRYVCRGYEDKFGIARETLRSEILSRLGYYAAHIFHMDHPGRVE